MAGALENAVLASMDRTWPADSCQSLDKWIIRSGKGGGKRVSATTPRSESDALMADDVAIAETAMAQIGQPELFMLRPEDVALDTLLESRGYSIIDPVNLYFCPIETLTNKAVEPVSAFSIWPRLAIMEELWSDGGINGARRAVMDRVTLPKTTILGRAKDRASGCAFVAVDGDMAMIHAIHVDPALRRNGSAINMMRAAAHWAQGHGARSFSLAVTAANTGANALYCELGLTVVGKYHYRIKKRTEAEREK